MAVTLALGSWGWLRPAPLGPVTRSALAPTPGQEFSPSFTGGDLDISPDGTMIVYRGHGGLWLRRLDRLDADRLPGTEGGSQPAFSPDGRAVAFVTDPASSLAVVSLDGGPVNTLVPDSVGSAPAWGPDGMIYYTNVWAPLLHRVAETGGTPEVVLDERPRDPYYSSVDVLPNGRGVLLTRQDIDREGRTSHAIGVLDLSTGELETPVEGTSPRYLATGHVAFAGPDERTLLVAAFDQDELEFRGPATSMIGGMMPGAFALADYAVSQAGTLVYAAGEPGAELVWVGRDGTTRGLDSPWRDHLLTVDLSPRGSYAAVSVGGAGAGTVWVKPLPEGPPSLLTVESNGYYPFATPDGASVIYRSSGIESRWTLFVKEVGGGGPTRRVPDIVGEVQSGFWSPDMEWIVYWTRHAAEVGRDIYAIRPGKDTVPTPLAASDADEDQARLSPDGRWLAYTSRESGRAEVYVVPFPTPGDTRWKISTDGGSEPRWSQNGTELFYLDASGPRLVAVQVTTGTSFAPGEHRELFASAGYRTFAGQSYAVSPDGQSFLMIRSDPARLNLVQNWFREVGERVEEGGGR